MTWPAADVGTTNADAGTDSPATARTDLLDLMTKFNLVRNHVSAFIQTLLDDAAASNARTTLGAAASGANACFHPSKPAALLPHCAASAGRGLATQASARRMALRMAGPVGCPGVG